MKTAKFELELIRKDKIELKVFLSDVEVNYFTIQAQAISGGIKITSERPMIIRPLSLSQIAIDEE